MTTRRYLSLIQASVQEDDIHFEEISADYIYRAKKGDSSFIMHDVEVGLNNSAATKLAMSKSGTFALLDDANLPAVEHVFLMNNQSRFSRQDSFKLADQLFNKWGNEVVLKQDNGSQGINVYKINNLVDLEQKLQMLFSLQVHAAISPYVDAIYEYRVVTLLGVPKIMFAKHRFGQMWKHNLINGAKAVEVEEEIKSDLFDIAKRSAEAMQLDFCTVDILRTKKGLFVLEINEQVMLDEYCKGDNNREEAVKQLYHEAIHTRFQRI